MKLKVSVVSMSVVNVIWVIVFSFDILEGFILMGWLNNYDMIIVVMIMILCEMIRMMI